jgi:hypothetical protein
MNKFILICILSCLVNCSGLASTSDPSCRCPWQGGGWLAVRWSRGSWSLAKAWASRHSSCNPAFLLFKWKYKTYVCVFQIYLHIIIIPFENLSMHEKSRGASFKDCHCKKFLLRWRMKNPSFKLRMKAFRVLHKWSSSTFIFTVYTVLIDKFRCVEVKEGGIKCLSHPTPYHRNS